MNYFPIRNHMEYFHGACPQVHGALIKRQLSIPPWVAKIKTNEGVSLDLITIIDDAMDSSGFTEAVAAGRPGSTVVPRLSTAVHRSRGWRALWSIAFDGSRRKSKRETRGSHQGVLQAVAVTRWWRTAAGLRTRSLATARGSSKGRNRLGLCQPGVARCRHARSAVIVVA
jgi:hypothetical protein